MLKPLYNRVILKLDEAELKTESGIIISLDEKKERKAVETGTVISATYDTNEYQDRPNPSPGDRVYIARYAGKEVVDTDGTEYVIVNVEDCLCIIKENVNV